MKSNIQLAVVIVVVCVLYVQGYIWSITYAIEFLVNSYGVEFIQSDLFESYRGTGMFVMTLILATLCVSISLSISKKSDFYLPICLTAVGVGYYFYRPMAHYGESFEYGLMILASNLQTFVTFMALLIAPFMAYWLLIKFVFRLPKEAVETVVDSNNTNSQW